MTQQEIHSSLDSMLENQKSRNFINHLVKAYMPISNISTVLDKPEGPFKCVLTKQELISADEILSGLQSEEYRNDFSERLKSIYNDNKIDITPIKNLIGDKVLGFTGTKTTTFMSREALEEFYNWVGTKSLMGDKHINWLLGSIRKGYPNKKRPKKSERIINDTVVKTNSKASTYTLGETDAFKKLKEKLN